MMAKIPSKIPSKSEKKENEPKFGKAPAVNITERDKNYEFTAELPGMTEQNIDVRFSDGVLTLKGEKRDEKEQKEKNYYLSERRFRSFEHSFRIPEGVDVDKIEASFENGVLTIALPKSAQMQKHEKKIAISKRSDEPSREPR